MSRANTVYGITGLGLFSLGYFVSEAVRVYFRKKERKEKAIAEAAYVCDEWALTLETAKEMDEAGGSPCAAVATHRDEAVEAETAEESDQLTKLSELALSTVSETAKAIQSLSARGEETSASQLTRLCELALSTVSVCVARTNAPPSRHVGIPRSPRPPRLPDVEPPRRWIESPRSPLSEERDRVEALGTDSETRIAGVHRPLSPTWADQVAFIQGMHLSDSEEDCPSEASL